MIYYIVAVDPQTRNEWVMSTHDSVVSATKYCDDYRKQNTGYEYRIDTTENKEWLKINLNAMAQSRNWSVGDPEPFPVTAAERESMTHPFTIAELFPPKNNLPTTNCTECGAYVTMPHQTLHTAWHNKVADL